MVGKDAWIPTIEGDIPHYKHKHVSPGGHEVLSIVAAIGHLGDSGALLVFIKETRQVLLLDFSIAVKSSSRHSQTNDHHHQSFINLIISTISPKTPFFPSVNKGLYKKRREAMKPVQIGDETTINNFLLDIFILIPLLTTRGLLSVLIPSHYAPSYQKLGDGAH